MSLHVVNQLASLTFFDKAYFISEVTGYSPIYAYPMNTSDHGSDGILVSGYYSSRPATLIYSDSETLAAGVYHTFTGYARGPVGCMARPAGNDSSQYVGFGSAYGGYTPSRWLSLVYFNSSQVYAGYYNYYSSDTLQNDNGDAFGTDKKPGGGHYQFCGYRYNGFNAVIVGSRGAHRLGQTGQPSYVGIYDTYSLIAVGGVLTLTNNSSVTWARNYGIGYVGCAVDADGDCYSMSYTGGYGYAYCTNSSGTTVWGRRYDFSSYGTLDAIKGLELTPNGTLLFAAHCTSTGDTYKHTKIVEISTTDGTVQTHYNIRDTDDSADMACNRPITDQYGSVGFCKSPYIFYFPNPSTAKPLGEHYDWTIDDDEPLADQSDSTYTASSYSQSIASQYAYSEAGGAGDISSAVTITERDYFMP